MKTCLLLLLPVLGLVPPGCARSYRSGDAHVRVAGVSLLPRTAATVEFPTFTVTPGTEMKVFTVEDIPKCDYYYVNLHSSVELESLPEDCGIALAIHDGRGKETARSDSRSVRDLKWVGRMGGFLYRWPGIERPTELSGPRTFTLTISQGSQGWNQTELKLYVFCEDHWR